MKKHYILVLIFLLNFYHISFGQQLKNEGLIDPYSTSSCYVILSHKGKILGNATGFFVKTKSKNYFITNNHVVGGEYFINDYVKRYNKNPEDSLLPDIITIRYYDSLYGSFKFSTLPLQRNNKPTYIKFYDAIGKKNDLLDVVAIPVTSGIINTGVKVFDSTSFNSDLLLTPSTELFIVGFPNATGEQQLYPIWKRGTIAGEARLDKVGVTSFKIDATTRKGMSGSPVIFRSDRYPTVRGPIMNGYSYTFLVGIYCNQNYSNEIGGVQKIDKIFHSLNQMD